MDETEESGIQGGRRQSMGAEEVGGVGAGLGAEVGVVEGGVEGGVEGAAY